MQRRIALVSLVLRDYAEAVAFYVDQLGFELTEDRELGGGKRWVVVRPPAALERGCSEQRLLTTAKALL